MDILLQALGLLENSYIQGTILVLFGMIPVIGGYSWVLRSILKAVPTIKDLVEQLAAEKEKAGDTVTPEKKQADFDRELKREVGKVKSLALAVPGVQAKVQRRLKASLGADKVREKAAEKAGKFLAAPGKGSLFE